MSIIHTKFEKHTRCKEKSRHLFAYKISINILLIIHLSIMYWTYNQNNGNIIELQPQKNGTIYVQQQQQNYIEPIATGLREFELVPIQNQIEQKQEIIKIINESRETQTDNQTIMPDTKIENNVLTEKNPDDNSDDKIIRMIIVNVEMFKLNI
jgi:hypothetical protein